MLNIIVSCEDNALYVKVEGKNLILITNPKDATKFDSSTETYVLDSILTKVRKSFDKSFVVASVSNNFFGARPKFVYKAGD